MNTKEMMEVMKAHLDGKDIQYNNGNGWTNTKYPNWNWGNTKYRIKSEEYNHNTVYLLTTKPNNKYMAFLSRTTEVCSLMVLFNDEFVVWCYKTIPRADKYTREDIMPLLGTSGVSLTPLMDMKEFKKVVLNEK